jgi:hypothetical protein
MLVTRRLDGILAAAVEPVEERKPGTGGVKVINVCQKRRDYTSTVWLIQ